MEHVWRGPVPLSHLSLLPLAPVTFSVWMVGAAFLMPARWPSVAASPATLVSDVRLTNAGTTVRMAVPALLLIQGHPPADARRDLQDPPVTVKLVRITASMVATAQSIGATSQPVAAHQNTWETCANTVNVKGSVRTVEPAYKHLMAQSCVAVPVSSLDTSVSWTNVFSVDLASAWRHLLEKFPASVPTVGLSPAAFPVWTTAQMVNVQLTHVHFCLSASALLDGKDTDVK